ncbi:hypothetical protein KUTeg_021240 [Tegillarca granosa]|uniref:Uncharacterized protein n=1 Tax=Tegillarca granosa TaxID=220873 RepID=A0ABQ9EA72_TEGGR|nr:hypothetical protein KUTeg_021240 [Tegillarca granosa]
MFLYSSQNSLIILEIAKVSEGFLKREWLDANGEREKGSKHNENLQIVINTALILWYNTMYILLAKHKKAN